MVKKGGKKDEVADWKIHRYAVWEGKTEKGFSPSVKYRYWRCHNPPINESDPLKASIATIKSVSKS